MAEGFELLPRCLFTVTLTTVDGRKDLLYPPPYLMSALYTEEEKLRYMPVILW